jgi:hypothetical protein
MTASGAEPEAADLERELLFCAESGHAKTKALEDLLRRISVGGLP